MGKTTSRRRRPKICSPDPDVPEDFLVQLGRSLLRGDQVVILSSEDPRTSGVKGFLLPASKIAELFGMPPEVAPASSTSRGRYASRFGDPTFPRKLKAQLKVRQIETTQKKLIPRKTRTSRRPLPN